MSGAITDVATFAAPWPRVLVEMKDYLDLRFLTAQGRGQVAAVRVFISRSLVAQSRLQPHAREFKASISRIPGCRIEFKATDEAAHKLEIEYRR